MSILNPIGYFDRNHASNRRLHHGRSSNTPATDSGTWWMHGDRIANLGGGIGPTSTATPDDLNYPTYLQGLHHEWLYDSESDPTAGDYKNVADEMELAASDGAGSPYADVVAYDPDTDLANIQSRVDDFDVLAGAMDPVTDVDAAMDAAVAKVDVAFLPADKIDEVVDRFEARSKGAYLRGVSRTMGSMFDIGAVMNTQYGLLLANQENDRQDQLNDIDARLRMQADRERTAAVLQLTASILGEKTKQLTAYQIAMGMQSDISRMSIIGKQDQVSQDLEYELRDSLWDLELFAYGGQMMGAITGAAIMPRSQTSRERLLSGGMNALSAGMAMARYGPEAAFVGFAIAFALDRWAYMSDGIS